MDLSAILDWSRRAAGTYETADENKADWTGCDIFADAVVGSSRK
jgi:hypothetical protein